MAALHELVTQLAQRAGPVLQAVWDARRVTETPTHQEIETHFRCLLADAELPPPDDVGYEPEAVVFYWNEPKLAVVVDFDEASC
jgi:hypothetical protein